MMTDWSPAPEDTTEDIISSSNDVRDDMRQQNEAMLESYNQTLDSALEGYVENSEYEDFKGETQSKFEVLDDNVSIQFTSVGDTITNLENSTNTKFDELHKYITFTDKGISISSNDSTITLELDNENGIVFKKNGEMFGWWDGNDFHTGNIVVKVNERAQFGAFAFIPRNDGSLSFLKVGEITNGS